MFASTRKYTMIPDSDSKSKTSYSSDDKVFEIAVESGELKSDGAG
jgi:hypothetical protein